MIYKAYATRWNFYKQKLFQLKVYLKQNIFIFHSTENNPQALVVQYHNNLKHYFDRVKCEHY